MSDYSASSSYSDLSSSQASCASTGVAVESKSVQQQQPQTAPPQPPSFDSTATESMGQYGATYATNESGMVSRSYEFQRQ